MGLFDKLMGSHSDREVKRVMPIVKKIEALAPDMEKLSDEELRAQTDKFKERLAAGETLDDILPEAFATVREAAGRTLGYKHYRVQLIGGIILHQGRIAEMKTGEGWWQRCRLISMRSRARAYMSLRSMITWQSEMPSGWDRFIISSASLSAAFSTV